MRKTLLVMLLISVSMGAIAQKFVLKDNFDTNANGWTEIVDKKGETTISEGVLRIKSKKADSFYESHFFSDMDVLHNFEVKCEVKVKSINDDSNFGLILNYMDDGNFILFAITEGNARLIKYQDYKVVGMISNTIKLKAARKAAVELVVRNTFQKLTFEVNGMKALEARFIPLSSNGIGFYVSGDQTVSFDNLEITQ